MILLRLQDFVSPTVRPSEFSPESGQTTGVRTELDVAVGAELEKRSTNSTTFFRTRDHLVLRWMKTTPAERQRVP